MSLVFRALGRGDQEARMGACSRVVLSEERLPTRGPQPLGGQAQGGRGRRTWVGEPSSEAFAGRGRMRLACCSPG